eukprot:scaffold8501_cov52-Phaeocystis_antarctica.AAC.3
MSGAAESSGSQRGVRSQGGAQAGRGKLLCEVELPQTVETSCQAAGRWGASCDGWEGAAVRWARLQLRENHAWAAVTGWRGRARQPRGPWLTLDYKRTEPRHGSGEPTRAA